MPGHLRLHCFLFILFTTLLFGNLYAQPGSVSVTYKAYPECNSKSDPRLTIEDVDIYVYLDNKRVRATGAIYAEGAHSLRVEASAKEGYSPGNFIISKIEWMKCNSGTALATGYPAAKAGTLAVNIEKSLEKNPCYKVVITIDKCSGTSQGPKEAKVKVITTVSREPGGPESPVSDMSVQFGDIPVIINEQGYGTFNIRPDAYLVNYFKASGNISKTSEPGSVTLITSKTGRSQLLATSSRKGNPDVKETKVPLFSDDLGSGKEFDYILKINMIVHSRAVNEVRVVGLKEGVMVHKAGTPEDNWIPIGMDMVFQEGDEISCDPDGSVMLQFVDGSTTIVKNTTQLKIGSYFTEGGVVKTEILLKMGEVASQVHKSEATKSDFRIKSPTNVSSRRGTISSHSYDPKTKTDIIKVEEGIVDVIPLNKSAKTITLRAGQQMETNATGENKVTSFVGKIDFTMPVKQDKEFSPDNITGTWLVTQGNNKGTMVVRQVGTSFTGELVWSNNQKAVIDYGSIKYGLINFDVTYEGDLKDYFNATLSEDGKKMIEGKGLSNKGTESSWTAVRK